MAKVINLAAAVLFAAAAVLSVTSLSAKREVRAVVEGACAAAFCSLAIF